MTFYDTVVIGAGPGGMAAAMYAARSELKVLLLERGAPGGAGGQCAAPSRPCRDDVPTGREGWGAPPPRRR